MTLLIDPFSVNYCSVFSIAAPLAVLSILTISFDKCQLISLEDTIILIKVKLFCLKNLFFRKSFYLKKQNAFENKNTVFKKQFFSLLAPKSTGAYKPRRLKVPALNRQRIHVPRLNVRDEMSRTLQKGVDNEILFLPKWDQLRYFLFAKRLRWFERIQHPPPFWHQPCKLS